MGRKVTDRAELSTVETIDVEVLFDRYTVPGWERSGILKMTGWVKGRRVTEEAFRQARAALLGRRI